MWREAGEGDRLRLKRWRRGGGDEGDELEAEEALS